MRNSLFIKKHAYIFWIIGTALIVLASVWLWYDYKLSDINYRIQNIEMVESKHNAK